MNENASDVEGRRADVYEAFRRYLQAKRVFLTAAERCSLKGWPHLTSAFENAFGVQVLLVECEAFRFEYLFKDFSADAALWKSVTDISDGLLKGWSDVEEKALAYHNVYYAEVLKALATRRAALDSAALAGPMRALERDPEYIAARSVLHEELQQLDDQLKTV
jgi:hypothetical protein